MPDATEWKLGLNQKKINTSFHHMSCVGAKMTTQLSKNIIVPFNINPREEKGKKHGKKELSEFVHGRVVDGV